MVEDRDIKYNGKEFGDFKAQLINLAKNYFPDTYNDFSEASPGMMYIEMASYVGDILSFYQDIQVQETFLQYAKNPGNLYSLAYMMGYRPRVCSAAEVDMEVSMIVDATPSQSPNWTQTLSIPEGVSLTTSTGNGVTFKTLNPVDFSYSSSYDPTEVSLNEILEDGTPVSYRLVKKVRARSGTDKVITVPISSVEKFKTFRIEDSNIIGIKSITDSENANIWYEVPFLGQDTIFQKTLNTDSEDRGEVPYYLSLQKVPRRFVTRFISPSILEIQFGGGVSTQEDQSITPNPLALTNINALDTAFDPSNFLFTRTYGLAPTSDLTVTYTVGDGVNANVPANTIIVPSIFTVSGNETKKSTIQFTNPTPATGGRDADTVEELRQNSFRTFAEQQRMVTLQDFTVRALSLPVQFGSIAKAYAIKEQNSSESVLKSNPLAVSLYILAYDRNKKLTYASNTLKANLQKYLSEYKMLTDGIDIKDAFIINIGVRYEILPSIGYPARDVLLSCNNALKEYFNIGNFNINQPLNISSITGVLNKVRGVDVVKTLEIFNKIGEGYSTFGYDILSATKNNIIYPSYDPCIFEVRYPDVDIQGRISTT